MLQISHGMHFLCTKIRRLEMYEPVLDFDG